MALAVTPRPGLVLGILHGWFPPPWFVPVEAPACGAELDVPAEQTNDATARYFVCDKPARHDGKHRQVTDNDAGESFEWAEVS